MAQRGYDTNLASEFHVLSVLHRLGLEPHLTLGNKKSVDIVIYRGTRRPLTLEVKGVAGKLDWLLGGKPAHVAKDHYYALVTFDGRIDDPEVPPSVWIIPSKVIARLAKHSSTGLAHYLPRRLVREKAERYRGAWRLLGGTVRR